MVSCILNNGGFHLFLRMEGFMHIEEWRVSCIFKNVGFHLYLRMECSMHIEE